MNIEKRGTHTDKDNLRERERERDAGRDKHSQTKNAKD